MSAKPQLVKEPFTEDVQGKEGRPETAENSNARGTLPASGQASAVPRTPRALRVWRFDLEKPGDAKWDGEYGVPLKMPRGARITRVGVQDNIARLFAVVNPKFEEVERYFWVANTDSDLPGPEDLQGKFKEAGRELEVVGLEPVGMWITRTTGGGAKGTVAKHLFEIVVRPAVAPTTGAMAGREPGED